LGRARARRDEAGRKMEGGGGGDDASRVRSVGRREAGERGEGWWGACVISSPILFLSLVGGRAGERGLLDARGRRCLPSIPPRAPQQRSVPSRCLLPPLLGHASGPFRDVLR
jgi:hypothetical protein